MKKTLMAVLFALFAGFSVAAYSYGDTCVDCAYIYIDMEDSGGFVEVYYVDCDGQSREERFKRESGYVFVDTDYAVLLIARPYSDYYFLGWGDDDLRRHSINLSVCEDIFLVPRFHRIHGCCDDDDYCCFIKSLKSF